MILYRKSEHLRFRRVVAPEPPFWYATAVSPYGPRRAAPLSIDYFTLQATGVERVETTVCEDTAGALARQSRLAPPILVDAAEAGEAVYGRGEEAAAYCRDQGLATLSLISTESNLPPAASHVAIAAWPLDVARLEGLFEAAQRRGVTWGVLVPVVYPATTDIASLNELAAIAVESGAAYLAAAPVELDPTARQALAQSLALGDDEYETLFHSDPEQLQIATERHVAALAAEKGVADFVTPPGWPQKTNWNASILLTRTAARMLAMQHEPELAGTLARAARLVAGLDKPLARVAAAASLSIVDALDEVAVDILTDWLEIGRSAFVEKIDRDWRLRRDHGIGSAEC